MVSDVNDFGRLLVNLRGLLPVLRPYTGIRKPRCEA